MNTCTMQKMWLTCLLSTIIIVNVFPATCQQKDDNCSDGVCVPISECYDALQGFYQGKRPQICRFTRYGPIVCCKSSNLIGFKSQQFCRKIYNQGENLLLGPRAFGLIGGIIAHEHEFPHMVALGYQNGNKVEFACGGSLISETFVLTAAHCLVSKEIGEVKIVRLGSNNLKSPVSSEKEINVKNRIKHPQYRPPSQYHDVGLLELEKEVTFSNDIKPACLQVDRFIHDYNWVATGWGHVAIGGPPSEHLQKIYLTEYPHYECKLNYRDVSRRKLQFGIVDDFQICAYGEAQEDTCQGDSGGPLQIKHQDHVNGYTIIGITSFGKACGLANNPGVYTRVSNYLSWIESIVWAN